jgi:hypothetical protein
MAVQPALLNLVPHRYQHAAGGEQIFDKQRRNFCRAIVMQTIYVSLKLESR